MNVQAMDRYSVMVALVDNLRKHGSWAGETHVQKAAYFLQDLLGVPLGFPFILYKHGPFSFDLRDELGQLRALSLLRWEVRAENYGPSLVPAELSTLLARQFPEYPKLYAAQIEFVSQKLASKRVTELERLATALWVTRKDPPGTDRAAKIHQLKPHVGIEEAEQAVRELDQIMQEVERTLAA